MSKVRKAVIPAAGLGTRFLPASKAIPKEMLPLVDKPTIQYVVEESVAAGIRDVLFVTSQGKQAIEDHFDFSFQLDHVLAAKGKTDLRSQVAQITEMISVSSVRQKQPLGLGHAVLVAEPHVGNEPFAVFLGDDVIQASPPAMAQMLDVFDDHPGCVLAVQEVPEEMVSKYGVVGGDPVEGSDGRVIRVREMVEKPPQAEAPSNLAIIGRYILVPEIFDALRNTTPGAIGEIQLTDGIAALLNSNVPVYAYRFKGRRFDAGDKLEYLIATVELALQRDDLGPGLRSYLQSLDL